MSIMSVSVSVTVSRIRGGLGRRYDLRLGATTALVSVLSNPLTAAIPPATLRTPLLPLRSRARTTFRAEWVGHYPFPPGGGEINSSMARW